MSNVLIFERTGPVATLTLSRPETRNGLTAELTAALVEACDEINRDLSIRCVILTALGSAFCAGGDIKAMYARSGHFAGGAAESRRAYEYGVQRIARALYGLEVPVIAAVNGPAMGAGLDIALMCDIRIASDQARFAESFIRLGLVSAAGGAWFLTRAVGASAAAELTFTGDDFDAEEALRLGVVSRVVAAGNLQSAAQDIAERIARHPAHSLRLNKRLLRESAQVALPTALELAAGMQGIIQQTHDQHEAVSAVVEKRQPHFEDR